MIASAPWSHRVDSIALTAPRFAARVLVFFEFFLHGLWRFVGRSTTGRSFKPRVGFAAPLFFAE